MTPNVGSTDKLLRVIVGLMLLTWTLLGTGTVRWFGLVGIVPLLTALVGYCPLYSVMGVKTSNAADKAAGG